MTAAKKPIKIMIEDLDAEAEKRQEEKSRKTVKKKTRSAGVKAKKTVKKTVGKTGAKRKTAKEPAAKNNDQKEADSKAKEKPTAAIAKEREKEDEVKTASKKEQIKNISVVNTGKREPKPEPKKELEDMEIDPVLKVVNTVAKEKKAKKHSNEKDPVEEIEETGGSRHSLKLYRRIAYFFIILTIGLIIGVLYFALVKVRISVVPNQEKLSNNMIFDVYDSEKQDLGEGAIKGVVKKVPIEYEKVYDSTGEKVIGEETVGTVTLINNYTKNQQLVATTRLLSPDGKLFRLKNTVNVPSGGKIGAEVYADDPGQASAIKPAKFTIPGLWAGIQDKIYAESDKGFTYRKKIKKHIQGVDIENGIRDLKQQLEAKTKSDLSKNYKDFSQVLFRVDDKSIITEHTGEVGGEFDEFVLKMKADVVVVAFSEEKAVEIAKHKFVSSLPQNKKVLSFDQESIIYSLNSFDVAQGAATINSNFVGKATLKENSQIIDIDKILGLNNEELRAYLAGLPEIAGFEVEYFPSFIKRVPRLVDRVNVIIVK